MNKEYEQIKNLLCKLKSEYAISCNRNDLDPNQPITERDIVSEIYYRLKSQFRNTELSVHTEIKPAPSVKSEPNVLKRLPKIDVSILKDIGDQLWIQEAITLQDKYKKGKIEARFSSVPIKFFHTAIEVKIQSHPTDSKKDIDTLFKILQKNRKCNSFLVLLNARGRKNDHLTIKEYAKLKGITFIEYSKNIA